MKLAYTCACTFRLDIYHVVKGQMYSEMYVDFVNNLQEGFCLHLDVLIAKEKGVVVSSCARCISKIVSRTCILLDYLEKCDSVCKCFHVCYRNIWSSNQIKFEGVTGSFLAINECLHPIQLLYMKLVYILTYLFPKLKNYFLISM